MELVKVVSYLTDPSNRRRCLCSFVPTILICIVFFIGTTFLPPDYNRGEPLLVVGNTLIPAEEPNLCKNQPRPQGSEPLPDLCKNQSRPHGSEPLPKGIISKTTNLEIRPLWGSPKKVKNQNGFKSLLAIAVGIKQKKNVDLIVKKFPSSDFVIMLFHYDGFVDGWNDLSWSDRAIHLSIKHQTKWWFAKRFLHPDVVEKYKYIFLWDEDLGVENFDPLRYLKIVRDEGLEISQPALDPTKSEVHHQITQRDRRAIVHRRIYKGGTSRRCDGKSTDPPCTGWVEMMAPVFSAAAWRCTWYLIQNDLTHAWGLDKELGYCAQGDRTINVGVVDAEYIVHENLPTLGENENKNLPSGPQHYDDRAKVRHQSYKELQIFQDRWKAAAEEDECWIDPYHIRQRNNTKI